MKLTIKDRLQGRQYETLYSRIARLEGVSYDLVAKIAQGSRQPIREGTKSWRVKLALEAEVVSVEQEHLNSI